MDDYKRGLYMRARAELKYEGALVCKALELTLFEEGMGIDDLSLVSELFPEFSNLYDEGTWLKNGRFIPSEHTASSTVWWEYDWLEPRIRALDCVLNSGVRPTSLI
jgi:hypothetical protein